MNRRLSIMILGCLLAAWGPPLASAAVDLSDGLSDAVAQIAGASGVGAEIDGDAVPVPDEARRWFSGQEDRDPLEAALSGGEDYELLFTVPARKRRALGSVMRLLSGVPCTQIGRITADRRRVVLRGEIIEDYPEDVRGHSCLMLGTGEAGRRIHVVCAPKGEYLAIITAYVPEADEWDSGFTIRRPL